MKRGFFLALIPAFVAANSACNQAAPDEPTVAAINAGGRAPAAVAPNGDWTKIVNESADGIIIGNPDAKVKLIEIASLSCPVCRAFEETGADPLTKMVKAGNVSWEFRPYVIHGSLDLAANLVARCNGPASFFPMMQALYRGQAEWTGRVQAASPTELQRIQELPADRAFLEMATLAGLQKWGAQRGLPSGKADKCLVNQKGIDAEVQVISNVSSEFPEFKGTPGFVLNGQFLPDVYTWPKLRPLLDAALQ